MQTTLALLIFLFPLAYSPGPGNMFFAANGARFGLLATLWANLGYHIATWLVTFAMGFGFLSAITRFPQAFSALQIIGAIYVLWLAWGMIRAGGIGQTNARPAGFWDGAFLLLVNPKAYLIIALMFSQFLGTADDNRIFTVFVMTSIFTINNMLAFIFWAATGHMIARRLRSSADAARLNRFFGLILAGVAIWMLIF